MKLRMRHNSLRLRLTRSEVAQLVAEGSVRESVEFPDATALTYELKTNGHGREIYADFEHGNIGVYAPKALVNDWAASTQVGMASKAGLPQILIEKDFQCMHGEIDPDAFEGEPSDN